MSSIIQQHDLDPEEQEELGLIPLGSEPHLSEDALKWIETAAYHLWLNEGCPDGHHLDHWDKAYRLYRELHAINDRHYMG